jgi:hypothetical protein
MFFDRLTDMGVMVLANRFFDIRDLISWTFAEAFRAFGDHREVIQQNPNWSLYCGKTIDGRLPERTITVTVSASDLRETDAVYINGNPYKLGGGISKGIPLEQQSETVWSREFRFYDTSKLSFHVTRGNWDTQEVLADGTVPEPHVLTVADDTTLHVTVANWKDRFE